MLFASLLPFVLARYALGVQFNVTVGGPGVLKFDPPYVQNATVGDVVQFNFEQKNHTVTQSTFDNPCEMAPNGFDSGFIPVADDDTGPFPAAQFSVQDSNPVWAYCRQADHCQQGMVFAINPGDHFPAFQAAAMGNTVVPSSTQVQSSTSSSAPPLPTFSSVPPPVSSASPSVSSPAPSATSAAPGLPPFSTQESATSSPSLPMTPSFSPTSASPVSTPGPQDHFVLVGGPNKFFFSPSNISAQVGDTITFQFQQKNHTVTQSSFADPCVSLTDTSTSGQTGFDSGFMPVSDSQTSFPTFKIFVNDTSPIWAFCRQANHCGLGMVFSVNAIESGPNNFAAFQARAMQLNGSASTSTTPTGSDNAGSRLASFNGAGTVVAVLLTILALLG